jgi:hypothetical protein
MNCAAFTEVSSGFTARKRPTVGAWPQSDRERSHSPNLWHRGAVDGRTPWPEQAGRPALPRRRYEPADGGARRFRFELPEQEPPAGSRS